MKKKSGLTRILLAVAIATVLTLEICSFAAAHCDTMDGPLVADAKLAFEKNNVNYALKWISQVAAYFDNGHFFPKQPSDSPTRT